LRSRPDGRFFKQKYLNRADRYFDRYGSRTVLIARFLPVVRTFGPIVAGATVMRTKQFLKYNLIGGIIWTALTTALGYTIGKTVPHVDKYLLPTVIVVVLLSVIPSAIEMRREAQREAAEEPELNGVQ
jgi:membrane-associated protein